MFVLWKLVEILRTSLATGLLYIITTSQEYGEY